MRKIRQAIRAKRAALPESSPLRAYLDALLELADEPLMDEIAAHTDANPERVGCPPYRVLLDLAADGPRPGDPAFEHALHCYPCSVEIRTLRRALDPRPS